MITNPQNEEDAHRGMIKYGEHWYDQNAVFVNPIDIFSDSFNQTTDELSWGFEEAEYIGDEAIDFFEFLYYVVAGFFDMGDSWEMLWAISKHNGTYKWLSS